MRDCARMKAPNEITAAQARDAFKRRASLFLLQETVAIRSAFSKKKIDLPLQAYIYTSLGVLFTSYLSPHILGGLCYCVWAIISDGDEWMNGNDISHSCTRQNLRGDKITTLQKKLYTRISVYRASFVIMVALQRVACGVEMGC